jgi:hypothetical protein
MIQVPSTLDDITAPWLTEALREGGLDGATIASATTTRIAVGRSLMCILARVVLEYAGERPPGAPDTVIAKFASPDPLAQAHGRALGLWEREGRFFSDLASSFNVRLPRCYYNGSDRESCRYALLLEDFGHMQVRAQVDGANPEQAKAVVRWLAGFHASWWDSPALASLDWMPTAAGQRRGMRPIIEASWPAFRERIAVHLPSRPLAWLEKMIPRFGEERFIGADCPLTVAHSDFRLDNMFFDGDEVVVIDWQSANRGQGIYDLVNFVVGSLPIEQRRASERDLLSLYRQELMEHGITPPAEDDMFGLYRQHLLTILPIAAFTAQVDPTDTGLFDLFFETSKRVFTAADDLGLGDLVGRI